MFTCVHMYVPEPGSACMLVCLLCPVTALSRHRHACSHLHCTALLNGHRVVCVWFSAMSNHVVGTCLFTYILYPSGDTLWHVHNCLHNCHTHSHHVVAPNMFGNLKWP